MHPPWIRNQEPPLGASHLAAIIVVRIAIIKHVICHAVECRPAVTPVVELRLAVTAAERVLTNQSVLMINSTLEPTSCLGTHFFSGAVVVVDVVIESDMLQPAWNAPGHLPSSLMRKNQ